MTARDGPDEPDTNELLRRLEAGDASATDRLLHRHRARLRKMIALRMDPRVAGRVDPSDVIQETLAEASQKLSDYARRQPLPFYPWLRQIAWHRLAHLHARHIVSQKRSVRREQPFGTALSDSSAADLVDRLAGGSSSPAGRILREEARARVRSALERLESGDRELLIMRFLEQLSTAETAAILETTPAAVKMRQARALQRLRQFLDDESGE